ncbi:hypothetical protein [Evansella sp. LMS18]|nr:hypothetical protein [Evansella sp. LMS18]
MIQKANISRRNDLAWFGRELENQEICIDKDKVPQKRLFQLV